MLRFLRPHRGHRLVWIDAICINQSDNLERARQVAKMGSIYRNSRRTVVYLGADIVHFTQHTHPLRRSVKEAATLGGEQNVLVGPGGKVNLKALLHRRYFSRIWVIQELLLSRQVSVPVGDMDISVDPFSIKALDNRDERLSGLARPWDDMPAPWFQYVSQGGYLSHGILEWTLLTSSSHASDPRDELFSLLGLVPNNTLEPDYGLSRLHAQIGVAAHSLFCLGSFESFYIAATQQMDRPKEFPSWVPYRSRAKRAVTMPWTSEEPRGFYEALQHHFNKSDSGHQPIFQPEIDDPTNLNDTLWTIGATVDTDTAALSLTATHLATFTSTPAHVPLPVSTGWEAYVVRSNDCEMYLLSTQDSLLQTVVKPLDHLYWLHGDHEKGATSGFLILRPVTNGGGKRFRLIGCCSEILFATIYKSVRIGVTGHRPIVLTSCKLRRGLKPAVDGAVDKFSQLEDMFPGIQTKQGQLEVFLALMGVSSWPSEPFKFFSEYLRHIDPRYEGVINKEGREFWIGRHDVEILTITIPSADLSKFVVTHGTERKLRFPFRRSQQIHGGLDNEDPPPWDEMVVRQTDTQGEGKLLRFQAELNIPDLLLIKIFNGGDLDTDHHFGAHWDIKRILSSKAQSVWRGFQQVEKAHWATQGMSLLEMVRLVQSGQDTSSIACPDWPADLVNAFQIQENTSLITIV
ncbi:heterokaryon incompatibility protein-domain-containing protein [Apiosordaria backusii]|uniref:Heterokaryon incompatibility protein-domain-containing protein n=1 Tax=Apiosordaria backusii TaxID=314023 RepID=A0AA40BDT7_9PEZI|nr:heterokaryon incompatibility protein-domain-containing protein [Apiosordaria backusii]